MIIGVNTDSRGTNRLAKREMESLGNFIFSARNLFPFFAYSIRQLRDSLPQQPKHVFRKVENRLFKTMPKAIVKRFRGKHRVTGIASERNMKLSRALR